MNIFVLQGPVFGFYHISLFQDFLTKFSVCDDLKVGIILPLFKGKGAKANNKDIYRGLTLCEIYEMIFLNRLEKYAAQMGFFLKCSLAFRRVWDALKPHSLLLRNKSYVGSVVAKFLAAFSMFAKPLTKSGLTGFFTNYF